MKLLNFFNILCSSSCFVLGTFQLIITLSANIKDSMWELGVLRSIGCTRKQIARVMIYELVANTFAAMLLGFASGTLVSVLAIHQFHIIVELPLTIELHLQNFLVLLIFTITSLYFGAQQGMQTLNKKNIASILKGQ